jgi:hypothetical protein
MTHIKPSLQPNPINEVSFYKVGIKGVSTAF